MELDNVGTNGICSDCLAQLAQQEASYAQVAVALRGEEEVESSSSSSSSSSDEDEMMEQGRKQVSQPESAIVEVAETTESSISNVVPMIKAVKMTRTDTLPDSSLQEARDLVSSLPAGATVSVCTGNSHHCHQDVPSVQLAASNSLSITYLIMSACMVTKRGLDGGLDYEQQLVS